MNGGTGTKSFTSLEEIKLSSSKHFKNLRYSIKEYGGAIAFASLPIFVGGYIGFNHAQGNSISNLSQNQEFIRSLSACALTYGGAGFIWTGLDMEDSQDSEGKCTIGEIIGMSTAIGGLGLLVGGGGNLIGYGLGYAAGYLTR